MLATLVERWERAQDGEGQTVLVQGEAGVGKSRLAYQLRERLAGVPHTWLECGATPYTEGTPFHPVVGLVAQGLAFAAEDTAAEKLAKLARGLGALTSTEAVALLAEFLGLPPPTPLAMSPDLQRRKTMDLLAEWNLALSAAQPLVVLVEDLHWCDASSLELLGRLVAQSPTARVLLVATARPEFTPPWPARESMTTLSLARLTQRQARDMVAALGGTELPAATLDALVARAGGVPLYIEELTKAVVEPGAGQSVEAIPAVLADSLMARLDRLSTAKEVAQRAAVLGREFGYRLLAAVAAMEEAALRHGLARLVEAEIVFVRGEPPEATYIFKHALVQEAAYESLLKRTRQRLHGRVVDVLVAEFPERAAAEPEVVARHVAIPEYCQGRFTSSLAHLDAARVLYRPERDDGTVKVGVAAGVTMDSYATWNLWALGWPDRALASAREAVALARQLSHPFSLAHALFFETALYWLRGEPTAQRERAAETIALSEAQGFPLFLGLGRAFHAAGRVASGELGAVADMPAGLALAAETGSQAAAPGPFVLLSETYLTAGQIAEARGAVETGLALATETGQPFFDAKLHQLQGEIVLAMDGAPADAEAFFHRALDIARAQEAKSLELGAATSLARLWRQEGRKHDARALLAPIYDWFTEGFDTQDLKDAKTLLEELS